MKNIADFPDWLGPMLVKELRQGLKTKGFVFSFIGLQVVLVLVLIYHVLLYARNPTTFDATGLGVIFWMLIGGLLLLVTPLRAFNELASERKANTLELIYMSGLSAWRITFGKWASLLFQALLFVLAVLPYSILRYYFGSVDLTEDLTSMLAVFLSCAVLSAVALALSGMPFWVRLIIALFAAFMLLGGLPGLLIGTVMGGRMGMSSSFGGMVDVNWWLMTWDFVLVCLLALQIGAQTVAPPAENHAGRQRFLALLLWLPVPAMMAAKVSDAGVISQLSLFAMVAFVLTWHQLSTAPLDLRSLCQPFPGHRAILGVPFQPGWPSATIFGILAVALFLGPLLTLLKTDTTRAWAAATSFMLAAGLFSAALFWRLFRRGARQPLVEQSIFLILCGVMVALLMAGKPSGTHLGDTPVFAILPAIGFWAMLDVSSRSENAALWSVVAAVVFAGYAFALLLLSRDYWVQYVRTCREIAHSETPPADPETR